jgi:hypothetical protein
VVRNKAILDVSVDGNIPVFPLNPSAALFETPDLGDLGNVGKVLLGVGYSVTGRKIASLPRSCDIHTITVFIVPCDFLQGAYPLPIVYPRGSVDQPLLK